MRKADIQASFTAAKIPWTPDMTVADLRRRKAAAEHDPARMSRAEISKLTIATMRELLAIHGVPELPESPTPRHLDYVNAVFALNTAAFAAEQAAKSRMTMDVFSHVAKFIKSHRDKVAFAMAVGDRAALAHLTSRERFSPKQITHVGSESTLHTDLTCEFMSDPKTTRRDDSDSDDEIAQTSCELNPADQPAILGAFSDGEQSQSQSQSPSQAYAHKIFSSFRTDDVFAAPPAGADSDVRVQVISAVTSRPPTSYGQRREYYIRDPDFPYVMLHVFKSVGYVKGRSPGDVCIGYYYYQPVSRKKKEEIALYLESPDSVATLDRFSVGIGWLQRYLPAMWPPTAAQVVHLYTSGNAWQEMPSAAWDKALARKIRALNKQYRQRSCR